MHITAGKYKKKPLLGVPRNKELNTALRPTTAKTRQAVFNILHHANFLTENFIENAIVLDLCCGCGSFGFEALSRGASHVTFIDLSPTHIKIARTNAINLGVMNHCNFLQVNAQSLASPDRQYNLIYIDPPYAQAEEMVRSAMKAMLTLEWLATNHIVVVETGRRAKVPTPAGYQLLATREYGTTTIRFFQK